MARYITAYCNKHQMYVYVATLLADKLPYSTYVRVLYLRIAIYIFDMYACSYIAVLVRMHAYVFYYLCIGLQMKRLYDYDDQDSYT